MNCDHCVYVYPIAGLPVIRRRDENKQEIRSGAERNIKVWTSEMRREESNNNESRQEKVVCIFQWFTCAKSIESSTVRSQETQNNKIGVILFAIFSIINGLKLLVELNF